MAAPSMEPAEALEWLYRQAAKATHPDSGGTNELFQRTEFARRVLSTALDGAAASQDEAEDPAAVLRGLGLDVVDKRAAGGRLWVVGGEELRPLLADLEPRGFRFTFAAAGGRATGHRAAWWLMA
jgi:hypothetical protein